MTCRTFTESIGDYLADDLSPESQRTFEHHAGWCRDCRLYLANYESAINVMAAAFAQDEDLDPAALPEELVTAILAARPRSRSS